MKLPGKKMLIVLSLLFVSGCASETSTEVTMIRMRPIDLTVEVISATPRFDTSPHRYLIEIRIVEPQSKENEILHLLVNGIDVHTVAFASVGSKWVIACDEEAFEHEAKIGFSFWSLYALKPTRLVDQLSNSF